MRRAVESLSCYSAIEKSAQYWAEPMFVWASRAGLSFGFGVEFVEEKHPYELYILHAQPIQLIVFV